MRDDSEVIRDESNDGEVMRDDGEMIREESNDGKVVRDDTQCIMRMICCMISSHTK